jgi:hypothetical protein
VLGHLGINVPDLRAAADYYGPLMPLLDYEPFITSEDALAFMPAEGRRGAYLFLYEATADRDYTREATGLQHLAFIRRRSGRSIPRPTSPRSGSIRSGSCSRPSAITTVTEGGGQRFSRR